MYDYAFIENVTEGSLRSARVIVPLVFKLVNPKRVVDVGCGQGPWLKVFQENGLKVIQGLDGSWVDRCRLLFNNLAA